MLPRCTTASLGGGSPAAPSVDLFVDPHRTVTSTDRSGREAIISCGAALDHFRVAMAAVGLGQPNVEQFPNPNNLDHLASTDFAPIDYVTQARRDRADGDTASADQPTVRSARRSTGRHSNPYCAAHSTTIWSPLTYWPTMRDRGWRRRLGSPKSLRRYDDLYHRELALVDSAFQRVRRNTRKARWCRRRTPRVDVNRRFPADPVRAETLAGTHDQAKILVLSTPEDTRADALNCGEALSAILLECTMAGLATCPVTHVTELESSRDIVRDLIAGGAAVPQVLIRVGIRTRGRGGSGADAAATRARGSGNSRLAPISLAPDC